MNWGQVFTWICFCKFLNINYCIITQVLYWRKYLTSFKTMRADDLSNFSEDLLSSIHKKKPSCILGDLWNFNAEEFSAKTTARCASSLVVQYWPIVYWFDIDFWIIIKIAPHMNKLLLFFDSETGFSAREDVFKL